jgi:transposase-like protein
MVAGNPTTKAIVDQDGDVLDILVTDGRDKRAAKRFFRTVLRGQGSPPWQLITEKPRAILPLIAVSSLRSASNASI